MFELHCSYDLQLSHFIHNYRQSVGITEPTLIIPRIINQEKGGAILFVWTDFEKDKSSLVVTNFGIYELETQKHTVFYTYEKKVKVVSCSVNPDRTLFAFSIVKPQESSGGKKSKDVYQAYLAELHSVDKTVFSLNMERSAFLKVQFLYPDHQRAHNKDSEMLVFLHKESIGLYRVSLGRIGEKGIIMSGQPKTELVLRKFVWCQWDTAQQRLHYIENVRTGNGSDQQLTPKMSTIQFISQGKYHNMIDIPVMFPFPYIRTAEKSHYGDIPLHPGIPDLALNMAVLTHASGAFCLCYHKQISSSTNKGADQDFNGFQDVEYYISMIHHAKSLYGCVSKIPKDAALQKRLVFSWLGSYLVVMLPGYFVHLLNVSPNFEPCHHILLHDSQDQLSFPDTPQTFFRLNNYISEQEREKTQTDCLKSQSEVSLNSSNTVSILNSTSSKAHVLPIFSDHCKTMKTLLTCQNFIRESGSTAQLMFDYRSGCLMKLVLSIDSMVKSFRSGYWETQLAILHYLILHNKDALAIKKLFEVIAEDLNNSEVNSIFSEYLIASTFAEMKKQVDKKVLSLLPFTFTQTFRGQVEKNQEGQRLAHISYHSLEVINLSNNWSKENNFIGADNFWETLFQLVRVRHVQVSPRFSHDFLMSIFRQAEMEEANGKTNWSPMHVDDSFFDGVYTLKLKGKQKLRHPSDQATSAEETGSGAQRKLDSILGSLPLFLQVHAHDPKVFKRRLSVLTKELLTIHLTKYLSKESQSKAQNVASEYLYCQIKVSRQLCHLIWSLQCQDLQQRYYLPNLQVPATDEEYKLFQLYERFYLTAGDLGFPLPLGFTSFFTALGFKCLELHLFFQYVDRHILILTPDFLLQLLEDLPDDAGDEVSSIKYQVISRLTKPIADEYFELWNHPITLQQKARNQVAQILLQGVPSNRSQSFIGEDKAGGKSRVNRAPMNSSNNTISEDEKSFLPLNTLMKHLESVLSNIHPNRPMTFGTDLIANMALNTTDIDLSTVNF